MSWLSSLGSTIGNVAKKFGSVAKSVVTPLASFAVGLIPGVGPLLSKGVDIIGNKLVGEDGDASSDAGGGSATPVSDLLAQLQGMPVGLGSSPAATALATATTTASNFLGIGGSAPGAFGIGDGKPGVFGIGTGKASTPSSSSSSTTSAGGSSISPFAIGVGIFLALLAL